MIKKMNVSYYISGNDMCLNMKNDIIPVETPETSS